MKVLCRHDFQNFEKWKIYNEELNTYEFFSSIAKMFLKNTYTHDEILHLKPILKYD